MLRKILLLSFQGDCPPRIQASFPKSTLFPLLASFSMILAGLLSFHLPLGSAAAPVAPDPSQPGPCPVSSRPIQINNSLSATIYYPSTGSCSGWTSSPYPGIAYAHGFSMFGFSNGAAENAGNAERLASWGFVAALPSLPDDAETRTVDLIQVLDYLEIQAAAPESFLYHKVDPERLGTAGHSLGGSTALEAAARDERVKAVLALDPVYHAAPFGQEGAPVWDPAAQGPKILVPAGILGAPPGSCNAQADYTEIYPSIGAAHKASFPFKEASHCDFLDPGNSLCSLTCGATSQARLNLSQKYMIAWLNYYLQGSPVFFGYLYGDQAGKDQSDGLVSAQVDTAPHHLEISASAQGVQLTWQAYSSPVVAGYRVYRRASGESTSNLYAQLGVISYFIDSQVKAGQTYSYSVRSYDPAGNEHQPSAEVKISVPGSTSTPTPPPPGIKRYIFIPSIPNYFLSSRSFSVPQPPPVHSFTQAGYYHCGSLVVLNPFRGNAELITNLDCEYY